VDIDLADTDLEPTLREVAARLRDIRSVKQRQRYRGTPPELPSRRAIAAVVEQIAAALFPRHFGPAGIIEEEVDDFILHTLARAAQGLRQQVELELGLADELKHLDGRAGGKTPAQIAASVVAALPQVRGLLDTDIAAAFAGDPSAKSIDEVIACYPGIAAVIRHRIAHLLYLAGATLIARVIAEIAHSETGIDIHPGAQIGEGFFIDHGTGVVIGETAIIGRRVRLYQAVTLGAKRFEVTASGTLAKDYPRHPIVEDDVVIYAGATVLGRVTIGQGSSIGGNVWLTHSVPPGTHLTQARARSDSFDDGAGI
jgi:serine O-acetyltransferase